MNLSERQNGILVEVRQRGFVSIETLAASYGVTTQTIRRDVNALCGENLLRRRHGGVETVNASGNLAYQARQIINVHAKRAIGRAVAALIPDRASLLIGIGTTPEQVAVALAGHEELTVVTNNLNVADALAITGSSRIILPGGTLRHPDRDLLGPDGDRLFRAYRADFAIFGVGGIDHDGALLDFSPEEVSARRAMREGCRRSILVADLSKIGRAAPCRGGELGEMDTVVFDRPPPEPIARLIGEAGAELIVAEGVSQ
ncbi:DeoR/GlpR family DNA-binding transcription regulator [Pleomorphomonas sp. JP5]|uniref:DeoR/GlpR family DNA-binding transcription regulator n=1 Tax=Pleomorphomonas sp. JP5 TaxID=2942998 RepID=UPI002044624D|nr:DeoR/GlpR family DNA-binding transcription regulator [Pleomorphomonas sp. JP5]MCM5557585.1 DeoR/GlpR family DNA-binding transcription regulator [Pleomorphomonas sp. JP5]